MTRKSHSIGRTIFLAASLLLLARFGLATEIFRLADVRPGMKGIGKTCVQGRELIEFQVEVLGVMEKAIAGHSVVLVRVSSPVLEKTGIFSGMSGSPVYLDGKLLGALAYGFAFATEPLAGVTPFEEMQTIFKQAGGAGGSIPASTRPAGVDLRELLALLPPGKTGFDFPARQVFLPAGTGLKPLDIPLQLPGISPASQTLFGDAFRTCGFLPLFAGAPSPVVSQTAAGPAIKLQPGQGIAVSVIRGDVNMTSGGTITEVDGDRLYAFGHQLMLLGGTAVPMYESETLAVVPSLNNSFKFFTTGREAGTIQQDRQIGIYGRLGQAPGMIPVTMQVESSRQRPVVYNFEVIRHNVLTPFLLNYGLFNLLVSDERSIGDITAETSASIRLKDGEEIKLRDVFSHPFSALVLSAQFVAIPVQFMMSSGFASLEIDRIDIKVRIREGEFAAKLESVQAGRLKVRRGETAQFRVRLQFQDGSIRSEEIKLPVPAEMPPGPVQVFVGDGINLSLLDQQLEPALFSVYSGEQLVRALRHLRQSGTLYVKLYRKGAGIYSRGQALPELPPSLLDIFGNSRTRGGDLPVLYSHYVEQSLGEKPYVIQGSQTFQLMIEP